MATIRSNTLRIVVSREEAVTCRVLGERVSRLYNAGNYLCRQAFLAGRPIPSYALLCRRLPLEYEADYRALPSDIAQEVIKKLGEAWQSFRALRKAHTAGTLRQKPGLPRYRKNRDGSRPFDFIPIKSARSYDVADTVTIALPADLRKKVGSR